MSNIGVDWVYRVIRIPLRLMRTSMRFINYIYIKSYYGFIGESLEYHCGIIEVSLEYHWRIIGVSLEYRGIVGVYFGIIEDY